MKLVKLVNARAGEALAMLRAMRRVATLDGTKPLSEPGRSSLQGVSRYAFGLKGEVDVDGLAPIAPAELAAALPDPALAEWATRFLAVTALVDGVLDGGKIALVLDYAAALRVREGYLAQLGEAARGNLDWALADMTRQNVKSLWDRPWRDDEDIMALILPYKGERADAALVARHEALGSLPPGTFGRAYWEIYKKNGYAFPGDPNGVNAAFARPHDSTHVLSGYDTTPQGEILVSTFTAGMHPKLPLEGHILPVIFSWHLGIEINKFAGSARGALDPEKFWVAWARGAAVSADLFAPEWNFWSVAEEPVESVRKRYHVPALDPRHAAGGH
jgi:hypothetical protein